MMQDDDRKWHLDKRVPIALIFALAVQTFTFGWAAASLMGRVERLEEVTKTYGPQAERLTRVEVRLEHVQDGVKRIEQLLSERRQN